MSSAPIDFARLTRADFVVVSEWLSDAVVQRWWADDPSLSGLEQHYGPSIDGTEPTEVFIASLPGQRFALIQRYRIDSYAEYQAELEQVLPVEPGTWSFDYLIGPPECRGRGLGTSLIDAFLHKTITEHSDANAVLIPVHVENAASWRTLERVGFDRVAAGELTPDNPVDTRDHYIYRYRNNDHAQLR
jgi:aminoglycoside 6'-N-acetyltransferase